MNEQVNMTAHYEHEIPEGYEAKIEGNKVIIELKESEDERIRQEIIMYFQGIKDSQEAAKYFQGVDGFGRWIAYLEKQKEQKPVENDSFAPSDPFMFNLESCLYNFGKSIAADCLDTHILDKQLNEYVTDEKVKKHIKNYIKCLCQYHPLQKPAEWSKEDEDMLNSIIATCQLAAQDRSSRPAWHLFEMQEKFLKSFRPQPKAEWSEDDEKFFKTALWHISYSVSNGETTDCRCDTTEWLNGVKERLKSLCSSWKPSEEQMNALADATMRNVFPQGNIEHLESLYNDLKSNF